MPSGFTGTIESARTTQPALFGAPHSTRKPLGKKGVGLKYSSQSTTRERKLKHFSGVTSRLPVARNKDAERVWGLY